MNRTRECLRAGLCLSAPCESFLLAAPPARAAAPAAASGYAAVDPFLGTGGGDHTYGTGALGNATARPKWHIASPLCDGHGATGGDRAGVHQKGPEDAPARDRVGARTGQVDSVNERYREVARITEMHRKWMENPDYRKEYEALGEEFALAVAVIEARSRAGLTQQQLAEKMGTTQPAIARLKSGRMPPSMRTLKKLAQATNTHLSIKLEPNNDRSAA